MADAWGVSWGNPSAWGVSWGTDAAPAQQPGYFDPGFWHEQHQKIKELAEGVEPVGAPVTALSQIPELIAPPKTFDVDDEELNELIELLAIVDSIERT